MKSGLDRGGVFVLILALGAGCIQQPVTHQTASPDMLDRRFTPGELCDDLDGMVVVFEEVHPDPYVRTSRERVDELRQTLKRSIGGPMTRAAFYPLVARLAASLGDGHTYAMWPSEEWNAFLARGGRAFPLETEYAESGLRVIRGPKDEPSLEPDDRVLRINGCAVRDIFECFQQEHAGGAAYQAASFSRLIGIHLWLHGITAPFEVEFLPANENGSRTAILLGQPRQAAGASASGERGGGEASRYSYQRLPEDIGYIDFRQMTDATAFGAFLDRVFREIHERPVKGLIVDLRHNGGGDSSLGQALLDYITDKPYKMADRKEWRASRRYKRYMKSFVSPAFRWMPLEVFHPLGRKFFGTPDGGMAVFEGEVTTPGPNALRFNGPGCFLIGPNTFSSAMMLANAAKDYKLACLIGEETGGVPNAFGEVYSFDLPNTRLAVGVSSAFFVRASGDAADTRGVLPDIEVRHTAADRLKGADAVLERGKNWVLENQSGGAGH